MKKLSKEVSIEDKIYEIILTFVIIFLILSFLPSIGVSKSCKGENFFIKPFCVSVNAIYGKPYVSSSDKDHTMNFPSKNLATISQNKNILCSKLEYDSKIVRDTAVSIAKENSGSWNVGQLVDLFEWTKGNINYVNDPVNSEYFATASETLEVEAGDCDDQAILITSLIGSVGGNSKLVKVPECNHAFSSVFVSKEKENFDYILRDIEEIYYYKYDKNIKGNFNYYEDDSGYWLIVDPAGGIYLGDILDSCEDFDFDIISC